MFTVRIGNETTVYYYYTPFKYNISLTFGPNEKWAWSTIAVPWFVGQ
jgi:hypothetical protein